MLKGVGADAAADAAHLFAAIDALPVPQRMMPKRQRRKQRAVPPPHRASGRACARAVGLMSTTSSPRAT